MAEWQMLVWAAWGDAKPTIDLDGPVAQLSRFELSGSGNCLEGAWTADPQAVTIKARDVVRLDVRENATDAWTPVYKGFVTAAGHERAESLQSYRAVGLKQRFYEVAAEQPVIAGGDVAVMVDEVLSTSLTPVGVSYNSANVPTLNFQLGNRHPAFETVGDLLDALADTVGRFIVPPGDSYTYEGVTYNEDEEVPAARWGVDANGDFFFRRPQAPSVDTAEGALGTRVQWERVSGEKTFDTVWLIYATEYVPFEEAFQDTEEEDVVPHPMAVGVWQGSTGLRPVNPFAQVLDSARVVPLTAPIDYMTNAATRGATHADITNPDNAFDNDDLTYAEWSTDNSTSVMQGKVDTTVGAIARVVFQKGHEDEVVRIRLEARDGTTTIATLVYNYDDADTLKRTAVLPFPLPAEVADRTDGVVVEVRNHQSIGLRVYSLEVWIPDDALAGVVAQGYEIPLVKSPSQVELVGQLGAVSQTMTLTPTGEAAENVDIERIEYILTTNRGLITRYHLGQSFDADLLSERAVLERLVGNGGKKK